ncbi:DUF4132 domain-containing protein [Niastella sp. OAS944]
MEPNYSMAYDYLSGKINQLPVFVANHSNWSFKDLYTLAQQPGLTPENDALLFSFFTCQPIYNDVRYGIAKMIFTPVLKTKDQHVFDKAQAEAARYSFSNDELFFLLINLWVGSEEELMTGSSPVLDFMHKQLSKMDEATINDAIKITAYSPFNTRLFYFLYRDRKDKAYAYAENHIKYDLRTSHANQDILKMLLQTDFEQFGPKILAVVEWYRDKELFHAGFRTYFIYSECAPVKDTRELINWSEQYITDYLKKPEEHHGGFSSVVYNMGYEHPAHGFYMPAYGWALYFILTDNELLGKGLLGELAQQGKAIHYNVLRMLRHVLEADAIPYMLKAVYERDDNRFNEEDRLKFIFDQLAAFKDQYDINVLWKFGKYANKQAESGVIQFLVEHDSEVVAKAINTMDDKKKEKRLMAARILLALDAPEAMEALQRALEKETDDETRDLIWQICGQQITTPVTEETVAAMVESARKRGKLKKPVFTWLDEATLPALYFRSGRPLTADELRFVLYRMSKAKGMRTDAEIKPVLQVIDKERSGDFAKAVYKEFDEKGFDAKFKFLLLLAAVFGNDEMVNKFCTGINKWIETNRKVMCEYGVEALALQGSNKALRWIEWYSRKFRSKKAYISEAAEKALTAAAEELEISIHELGDRIVPDFGFEGLFKHFTINGEEYRAFIDSNFKLAYFNEDNKKLKSIPSAADKDLVAEFKTIAKEVRDVVKAQSSRLEHYLVVQRKWAFEEWQQFFLNNPIMFIYATKLLWGIYDNESKLVSCFICQEDTTLVDKEGNEIETPEGSFIGIVHPISLTAEDLQVWKRQFFDLSIEPVFPQLERPVYFVAEEDKAKRVVQTFVDVPSDSGSIKNTLDKYGWRKVVGDGGFIDAFHYLDRASKIEAELEVEDVLVYGFDDEATLGKLFFVDTTVKSAYKAGVTNTELDDRLIQLGKLSPVFYSEVVAAVKAIKVKEKNEA